jgi:aryl-alcohol dehydrogenase-like predicted oxidoreductase
VERRPFGSLGEVSALTLGGGGIGQVWGATSAEEAEATVHAAVDAGIDWLDVAPTYGDGEAERVIGQAFGGQLPDGVRISTKCLLGRPPAGEVYTTLSASLVESLERTRLSFVDLFVLHGQIVPDGWEWSGGVSATTRPDDPRRAGTPRSLFVEEVRPAFERLVEEGRIGAWGITGVGEPSAVIETLGDDTPPVAAQCIVNLLHSPGGMRRFGGPFPGQRILDAARAAGTAIMGIRAVQAGALTDALDRELSAGHPEVLDFKRASPFRALASETGESAASLAHRYALSVEGVSTVVLGVKNREELAECVEAEARGPLDGGLMSRIEEAVATPGG